MLDQQRVSTSRAFYITITSGKGGVGKSTVAMLLASRLADVGKRTLLIDTCPGIGDIVTMANAQVKATFIDLIEGQVGIGEAAVKVAPRLWILGTHPAQLFDFNSISSLALENCAEIDGLFDTVVLDTSATIDSFVIGLASYCDLQITVITPRVSAVADSYIQLKRIIERQSKSEHGLIVNLAESESEGEQATQRFEELVKKFLNRRIRRLGVILNDPEMAKANESQSLLRIALKLHTSGKNIERTINLLEDNYLRKRPPSISLWKGLQDSLKLKDNKTFDERETVAFRSQQGRNTTTQPMERQQSI